MRLVWTALLVVAVVGCRPSSAVTTQRLAIAGPTSTSTTTATSTSTSTSTADRGTATATETTTVTEARPTPYDLSSDREQKIAQAKRELGTGASIAVVDDVFVLVGAPGWNGPALKASVKLVEQAVAAYRHDRFAHGPSQAIAVYLFATADPYRRFCRTNLSEECISPFGFYLSDERRMIMNAGPGLGTLTHELVHPFVEADFPTAPIWINEGIASLYEAPVIPRDGEIRGVKNWRLPRLVKALTSSQTERDGASLDKLFRMPDDAFRNANEDLHYAMARYACQWLDERKQLWPFYHRWRDSFADDPTGERSFREVTGSAPTEASAAWTRWVKAL
jgi:hypothetical protein